VGLVGFLTSWAIGCVASGAAPVRDPAVALTEATANGQPGPAAEVETEGETVPATTQTESTPGAEAGVSVRAAAPCDPADLGRETLPRSDGWASLGTGTTGGALATDPQIYAVTTRAGLIAALNNGAPPASTAAAPSNEPKIIYVDGTIDFNTSDDGAPLSCADYYRNGFTWQSFLAAYDPAAWGRIAPAGPLETARLASRNIQQERVRIRVGSNTTLVGRGKSARLRGAWLDLRGTAGVAGSRTNIIIRNLVLQDTYDCFPEWTPTDGALGNWNALYDAISLRDTDHVWIDHNTFEDRATADALQPAIFGVLFQVHDGLLDITNASDQVTVSWNQFRHHDKTMLIGSSDSAIADRGKLRVTLHHNLFEALGQRVPRVRFGQVHVYNNLYRIDSRPPYVYSWGVGIESAIRAENNYFEAIAEVGDPAGNADPPVSPSTFIQTFKGTALFESGTLYGGTCDANRVELVAAYNTVNDPDLGNVTSFTPVIASADVQPTADVPDAVRAHAGARARRASGWSRTPAR
jgi:pectate lyase